MKRILNIAKALSDENRIRALLLLREDEKCVCEIIAVLGLAPSTVSKHMSILKQAELVDSRRDGKWTYYRLCEPDASPAAEAMEWLKKHLKNTKTGKNEEDISCH